MFRDDITVIDEVVIKGRCIVILEALQQQVLRKVKIGMNADNENHIKLFDMP